MRERQTTRAYFITETAEGEIPAVDGALQSIWYGLGYERNTSGTLETEWNGGGLRVPDISKFLIPGPHGKPLSKRGLKLLIAEPLKQYLKQHFNLTEDFVGKIRFRSNNGELSGEPEFVTTT